MYYYPISVILKAMALEQDVSSRSESLYVSCRKRGYHTYYIAPNHKLC